MMNDYIMKIVEQFVQALLTITQRRKAHDYQEARQLVRTTGRSLLRMDIDILLLLTDDQILDQFKDFAGQLETQRCVFGADLFYELALIEEAELRTHAAKRLKTLSLYLYTHAIPKEPQFQQTAYYEKISALIEELEGSPLSDEALVNLENYTQFIGYTQ